MTDEVDARSNFNLRSRGRAEVAADQWEEIFVNTIATPSHLVPLRAVVVSIPTLSLCCHLVFLADTAVSLHPRVVNVGS